MTPDWPADKVERWPLMRLIPYARNARTHSPEQVRQLAASMREWGWTMPVLADEHGMIIAGHARVQAAELNKYDEAPVMVARGWSEAKKRAYVLADNRLAMNAGWDEELLRVELESLKEEDFNLDLVGFTGEELEALLRGPEEYNFGLSDDDVIPDAEEFAITRRGDVWLMRDHRLLCGDATSAEAVKAVLAGGLADMVFTDPPYNVDYEGKTAKKLKIGNDKLGGEFYEFLRSACANVLEVTKGAIYVCMSSGELHTLHRAFTDAGGHWSTFVVWAKHHFTLGRSDYQRQYEPILYGWREGTDHFWCGARDQGDIWFIKRPSASEAHPTIKPVALVERAVRNSSKTRDTVLDPFGGAGTTLVACEKAGRQARLIEVEPRYCDVIVRRWQAFTGKEARREADGKSYREASEAYLELAKEVK